MIEQRVAVRTLDRAGALACLCEIRSVADGGASVCLDFTPLGRSEPFGMLLFSAALKAYRADMKLTRPSVRFRATGHEGKRYQAHMGFFRMFGLEFGNAPDEASGSGRYEPIRFLSLEEIHREAADEYLDVHEGIERRSQGLARMLVHENVPDVIETLGYCLREMIRNSLEHARVDGVWYCAQYWPTRDLVELALLDQGIGIRESLARNPHLNLATDEAALRQAVMPGVSGVAFKGAKKQRNDEWRNSGYGLYMTSQLAGMDGEFFIASGNGGLEFSQGKVASVPFNFQGTAVSIRIKPSKVARLRDTLAKLRQQAANISGQGVGTHEVTASMSSIMLSKDFGKR